MHYPVYFENSHGVRRIIGQAKNGSDVIDIVNKFLEEHNFKCYYVQTYKANSEWVIDVGSHTEFFYVSDVIDLN